MRDPLPTTAPDPQEVSAEALTVALDGVATPTFLLRPDGHIVHANGAANALLRGRQALYKTQSRLSGRRTAEAKHLAAVLLRVAGSQRPELLRLFSRSAHVSLLMTVTPVPGGTLVAACVADLQADRPDLKPWIERAFDLSPQNADLAEGLLAGASLAAFSDATGVTLGATRTRLKKLFTQTGNRTQAALVSVLSRAATLTPRG